MLEIRRGVDHFDMKIPDASPQRWQAMLDATVANRERWGGESESPTFAATRG